MNRIRLFSTVGVVAGLLAVFSMLLFAQDSIIAPHYGKDIFAERETNAYAKGVNDALDAIMLLSLEQRLEGTNRTWGAMAEIVCERMNIERRK